MKVTIPITFTKYTPGPIVPSRLVSIHDERDGGFDYLGLEYTDGSIKVPRFQNESDVPQICILEDGQKLLFNRDEDKFSLYLDDEYYNLIKDEKEFIFCDYYAGWDKGDTIHAFWYILEFDFGKFGDQINLGETTPKLIRCKLNDMFEPDDEEPNAEVDTYDGVDLLCINKNGKKFYLFDGNDESWLCKGKNIRCFANSCSDLGIKGDSVPKNLPIAYAIFHPGTIGCRMTEGVVETQAEISVYICGTEYGASFRLEGSGEIPVPISTIEFAEI